MVARRKLKLCVERVLFRTYTLYLRNGRDCGDGPSLFEPVLCQSASEVVGKAFDLLERHPDCQAVDVFFGDAELFRVGRPKS